MMNDASHNLMTVTQYASRFQVSRTTVFAWIKSGELREGIDYLRRGRILRFIWPPSPAVQHTNEDESQQKHTKRPAAEKNIRSRQGAVPVVNLDY